MNNQFTGPLVATIGVFAICGAQFQWAFFMEHHKARFLIRLFGRRATRAFYLILGSGLTVVGVSLVLGFIVSKEGR